MGSNVLDEMIGYGGGPATTSRANVLDEMIGMGAPASPQSPTEAPKRTATDKALSFVTMGHVGGEYGPEEEVKFSPEGRMTKANVPTGDPGFFQDPVTALAMGGVAGVRAAVNPIRAAARETLGWFTGGASEAPALAKTGVEVAAKKTQSARQMVDEALKRPRPVVATPPLQATAKPVAQAAAVAQKPTLESLVPQVQGGPAGPLPKYADESAINLERLDTTDDVKHFINGLTNSLSEQIGKRKMSWDEIHSIAESHGWDVREVKKQWDKKGAFTADEVEATRQVHINTISSLHEAIKTLPYDRSQWTPEIRAQLLDAMDMVKVTSQVASEAGRALNIHKKVLANDPAFKETSQFNRVLKVLSGKGVKRTDDILDALRGIDFNDVAAVNRFIYNVTTTPWQRLSKGAYSLWMEGLLSNPLTHIVNITSNALTMAYTYPERLVASAIEGGRAAITGTTRGLTARETIQDAFSIGKGIMDATKRFANAMQHGDVATKIDYPVSGIPEKFAKYMPTRALGAEDAFFKGLIEHQELNRLAYRQVRKEGLEGEEFSKRLTETLASPPEWMLEKAAKRGQYLTYQKELGEVGRLVMRARDTVPGLKYFIPFVRTPINIAKFSLERTPLNFAVILSKAMKGELKGTALSEELAKPLMGTVLGTAIYQLAEQGYITGGNPENKAKREEKQNTGWQPYSVKIGDAYYSFQRLEPLGSILGMAADMSQIKRDMSENDRYDLGANIVGSITTNISDKTFMQGITNLINGISDPGRYGQNIIKTLAGSLIPAGVAAAARAVDPLVRDTKTIPAAMQARIPVASEELPPKLTVWGEPIERVGTPLTRSLSPMQVSHEKGSPIERELVKLNLDIGYPPRRLGKVDLEPNEYWQMVEQGGKQAKILLDGLARSGTWKHLSSYEKESSIRKIVNQYRERAQQTMLMKLLHEGRYPMKDEADTRYLHNHLK